MKMRVTNFKLKKLAGGCDRLEWSNSCSGPVRLRPGRYAIIPYTDIALDDPMEYKLVVSYKDGAVDFEIKDILVERPIDEVGPSLPTPYCSLVLMLNLTLTLIITITINLIGAE